MASQIFKTSFHTRSVSLPLRPHPISDEFDEQLSRLRSSQTASTSLSHNLTGLKTLFDCVDELLLLPSNHKDLQANYMNVMLDGSLRLLDICGIARDALLQTKEHIQTIQSVLRRRCSGEMSIDNEITQYLSARKKVKKAIKNCFRDVKKIDQNDKTSTILGMFKDVETVTTEIFKSLLTHISGSKTQSKKSSWSLVGKLVHQASDTEVAASISRFEDLDAALSLLTSIIFGMFTDVEAVAPEVFKALWTHISHSKKNSWSLIGKLVHQASDKEEAASISKFEALDASLSLLICQKKKTGLNMMQADNLRNQKAKLECKIQDFDEVLESLFRHLVKIRATLLNILSN